MILSLGPRYLLSDRSAVGEPGRAWNQGGYGIPRWGAQRAGMGLTGTMKPMPIGARYFCGDSPCKITDDPVALGHKYGVSKAEYQVAVTAHYTDEHPDLHYPIDQDGLDRMHAAKTKARARKVLEKDLEDLKDLDKWLDGVGGGTDMSSSYRAVARPRELPDFTEFDFPDANVADGASEEIELDQLISIAARQGRRLLGVELQNVHQEFGVEFLTAADNADLDINAAFQLNTRTGDQNLDDPENLWRAAWRQPIANIEAAANTGTAITAMFSGINNVPIGGRVYVAPRLFWRFNNETDRQTDTGDMFAIIATISQRLGTFLLFELLEQHSGLFALT